MKFIVLCLLILAAFSTIEARNHHGNRSKEHKHKKGKGCDQNGAKSQAPAPSPLPNSGTIFNILSFRAKANGVSDDSKVSKIELFFLS